MAKKSDGGDTGLNKWFSTNCRMADGTKDWYTINKELNKIYSCEFQYSVKRPPFTIKTGLEYARKAADKIIEEFGFWSPEKLLEADSSLCEFLRRQKIFRKEAIRNDLKLKRKKGLYISSDVIDTRPNWFIIASSMGDKYFKTLQLGNILNEKREQEFRSFEDACEELEETIKIIVTNKKGKWIVNDLIDYNLNLYMWFKKHCRNEDDKGINWKKIFANCNEEVLKTYGGIFKY